MRPWIAYFLLLSAGPTLAGRGLAPPAVKVSAGCDFQVGDERVYRVLIDQSMTAYPTIFTEDKRATAVAVTVSIRLTEGADDELSMVAQLSDLDRGPLPPVHSRHARRELDVLATTAPVSLTFSKHVGLVELQEPHPWLRTANVGFANTNDVDADPYLLWVQPADFDNPNTAEGVFRDLLFPLFPHSCQEYTLGSNTGFHEGSYLPSNTTGMATDRVERAGDGLTITKDVDNRSYRPGLGRASTDWIIDVHASTTLDSAGWPERWEHRVKSVSPDYQTIERWRASLLQHKAQR